MICPVSPKHSAEDFEAEQQNAIILDGKRRSAAVPEGLAIYRYSYRYCTVFVRKTMN